MMCTAMGRSAILVLAMAVPVYAAPRQATSPLTEAGERAAEFDLAGAANLLQSAVERGDTNARVAAVYVRGLIEAREAWRQGGSPESLAPVRQAISWLEAMAKGQPGSAEIARLMLQAAAAAAQSEREEMRLYLDTAIRMEALQRAAGMPGAPLVAAAESAGDLWLQVHRYEDARSAYDQAAERFGPSLRTLAGRARASRGLNDPTAACAGFRALLEKWAPRPEMPAEIVEARAYVVDSCVLQGR